MEEEGIGLVLSRASELRSNITNCIDKASSLRTHNPNESKATQQQEPDSGSKVDEVGGADQVVVEEEDYEEAESLPNIRDAFESLESQLSSLQLYIEQSILRGALPTYTMLYVGHRKVCLIFCILHLFVGIWKKVSAHPSIWVASICLSLATSIFSISFETWMVVEHEKQGHGQDTLSNTFWLMTFFESASFIGSQVLANWLVGRNVERSIISPSTAAVLLAIVGLICVSRGWPETPQATAFKDYRLSFYAYIFGDDLKIL